MSSTATPWGKEIATETIGGIPYRMYTDRPRRVEHLIAFTSRWGNRPHIIHGDRVLSFADLRNAAQAKATELKTIGIKNGNLVFILGWNSPEWVVNFWACLLAGGVPVLANAWWSGTEVAQGLIEIRPHLVLADTRCAEKVPPEWPMGTWDIDASERPDDGESNNLSQDESQTALIIFTSGTSGNPKAVVLSHRAVLARLQMTLHITRKLPHQVEESARDVTLLTGPLFHVGSMQSLLRAAIVGDTIVLSPGRYDPAEVLALIERHKVNRWNCVPTMVLRLLDHPKVSRRDLTSLKSISIGGAPVHAELMQRIRVELPSVSPRIPTGYGLTENGGQATASAGADSIEQIGSTGKPLPCVEVDFLPHPGLPDGEILLRSPTQMTGYFGLDDSPINSDGWLHTGDLGRLDEKGNLWITGRCKDMIIRGGENIAPVAIERALLAIPGVADAAVFGVPHPDLGEEVMAVVAIDREVTVPELEAHLRKGIASFSVPSRWKLQTMALPTNDAGKIDKKTLRAQVLAGATAPGN